MNKSYVVPFPTRGSILAQAEIRALTELVGSGAPLSMGSWRERFESEFAAMVGARHAVSVTSGTVALQLAITLLDLEPGDEVIATPQTYQATVQPLLDHDVVVRFCDVEAESLNVSPEAFEALITPRTKALLLVHYGGCPADMAAIMGIARRHGILVLEDCAHALGAVYRDGVPGSLADIACFSFQNSKNITTLGEGGMITCSDDEWVRRLHRLRGNDFDGHITTAELPLAEEPVLLPWMKYSRTVYRDIVRGIRAAGTNATLSEPAAAVGVVQLSRLQGLGALRRTVAARLNEVVARYPFVSPQRPPRDSVHAYHLYTCFVQDRRLRDELVLGLDRNGVEIQLRYFPQHLLPEWRHRGHRPGECPVAEESWFTSHVNLPCHPGLDVHQVDYLVDTLDSTLAELSGTPGTVAPVGAAARP
ncbi:dTDP-4-amino-4,6-dideoxygalactose transaminase [Amycolatopsis bartoniae]|uniref:Aminotransferase n=1 Tax=Amycolatopsis bartoniae TaxID=941986 RepID=A0A8H9IVK1_9PSEU|nr:DegT/DnrJ/EryC1/StrS family aminotransferase [Amycolatopsis bartoniae]MBB2940195.1 dTDP-4-amino-4,6-dideoxygalactose transaminase [Amycolatopsis bartoniae]GHF66321.1 aminotransferase [Amycolatopsis bartoniae]